jgi:hypothetical protein
VVYDKTEWDVQDVVKAAIMSTHNVQDVVKAAVISTHNVEDVVKAAIMSTHNHQLSAIWCTNNRLIDYLTLLYHLQSYNNIEELEKRNAWWLNKDWGAGSCVCCKVVT